MLEGNDKIFVTPVEKVIDVDNKKTGDSVL